MTTLSVNRPVVEDIRETTSISPTTATTTVIPTRSCDHFNCFWLGKFPRLPRRLCASANGNRCSAAHARDLQPAAMRCGADALVRVGGSVGLLWRGRPRPRWRRPDAHICAPFADMGLCSASVEAWVFRPSYNAFMTWLQPRFGSIKARDTYQAWL